MLAWVMFRQYFPHRLRGYLEKYIQKLMSLVVSFHPHLPFMNSRVSERLKRSEAFSAIQNYLSSKSTKNAKRLKADVVHKSQSIIVIAWKRGYLLYGPPGTG
jgi:chaperone BCS1